MIDGQSHQELLFHLVVRNELASIRLSQAFFNLRDEAEPFDSILEGGMFRQGSKRLDGTLLIRDRFHKLNSTIVEREYRGSASGQESAGRENVNPGGRQADVDDELDHLPSGTSVSSTRQAA